MSAKRWLNGTTSRKANSTWTPGSATRSSPSISWRLRSTRSCSVSLRPLSGWRSVATRGAYEEPEREVDRERPDEPDEREPEDREPDEREPEDRAPEDRELDERELDAAEREPFDELRRAAVRRREPPLVRRSAAGISSRATLLVSCGIWPSRNFAIRSSSRRMPRASLAVSLSPTVSASVSIAL